MLSNDIYKQILQEYEQLTDKASHILARKKEILYKKCPEIEEIDNELSLTCLKISKAIINSDKFKKDEYLKEIEKVSLDLQIKKEKIMTENGFFKTYFEDVYECKKCKDTGFINNIKCECFKQKLINKAYNMSNMSEIIKIDNFSNFNYDYYSKNFYDEEDIQKISSYDNINSIMKNISIFIEEFDKKFKNIIFYGTPGLGKTFICRCIAKEILDKGKTVVYVTAFELFDMVQKYRFSKEPNAAIKEQIEFRNDADLLIIDDLGAEFVNSLSSSDLFNVINNRLLNKKPTIISTNLAPQRLMELYSERLTSRFYGEYDMMKIFGEDIRIIKKFKNQV